MTHRGTLIIIDAIDGAGKYTVVTGLAERLAMTGKKIFNLTEYAKQHHTLPDMSHPDLANADVLVSSEPTFCWIGQAIREEITHTHTDRTYSAKIIAEAFAMDRHVLFTRIILPFLANHPGRIVLQERGCITSLAYQPVQDPTITVDWLLSLAGNRTELSRPPDLLLLLQIDAELAKQRLMKRTTKQDDDVFETPSFQKQVALRYLEDEVLAPYRERGTRIAYLDAGRSPEAVLDDAYQMLASLPVSTL